MKSALDQAVELFDGADPAVRRHVRIRRALSRLEDVEAATPREGRILEIGCGHGLVTRYLVAAAQGRTVHGFDIDVRKIAAANALPPDPRATFAVGDALAPPAGPYDAAVVVDVLYLLPAELQRRAIEATFRVLEPGGVFVWKSQENRPLWRYWITKGQEWLATSLGLTAGSSLTFLSREAATEALAAAGFKDIEALPMCGRLYTDVIYRARR